jgi:hypothetical protein
MNAENKHDRDAEQLRKLLQEAIPPTGNVESNHDLWPRLLRRIVEPSSRISPRVPWFDWALLGVAAAALLLFPALIPMLLYHL